uniref:Uncharacterized protein n=1 Tax=Homalodisca liturata TaxID=320908 RepID=A0A1B6IIA6_9HEMI
MRGRTFENPHCCIQSEASSTFHHLYTELKNIFGKQYPPVGNVAGMCAGTEHVLICSKARRWVVFHRLNAALQSLRDENLGGNMQGFTAHSVRYNNAQGYQHHSQCVDDDPFLTEAGVLLTHIVVDLLCKAGETSGHRHHESSDAERGVDWHQSCPECCRRPLAAQQDYETEEPYHKLEGKESHGDETHPAMHGVKVGFGRVREAFGLEHCQEAEHHTRDSQCMEDHMEQLDVDLATTSADAVKQHRKSTERDETGDHESGMSIELPGRVLAPGVAFAVIKCPEEDEDQTGQKEQAGQHHDKDILAPTAAGH